ncbi:MAG: hypothetical protein AB8G05_21305 [Oligoflexales bacterium]
MVNKIYKILLFSILIFRFQGLIAGPNLDFDKLEKMNSSMEIDTVDSENQVNNDLKKSLLKLNTLKNTNEQSENFSSTEEEFSSELKPSSEVNTKNNKNFHIYRNIIIGTMLVASVAIGYFFFSKGVRSNDSEIGTTKRLRGSNNSDIEKRNKQQKFVKKSKNNAHPPFSLSKKIINSELLARHPWGRDASSDLEIIRRLPKEHLEAVLPYLDAKKNPETVAELFKRAPDLVMKSPFKAVDAVHKVDYSVLDSMVSCLF